jgi:hypothetical protein
VSEQQLITIVNRSTDGESNQSKRQREATPETDLYQRTSIDLVKGRQTERKMAWTVDRA